MAKKPRNNYVNNAKFHEAMVEYKKQVESAREAGEEDPRIPNYIGECIYHIANRMALRPNFFYYSYKDEMIADALENAVRAVHSFDPAKSSNPFGYFTQIIWRAFVRRIQKEHEHVYRRHKVIENSVLTNTAFERGVGGDTDGGANYIDLDNEYMSDFVEKYEATVERKKEEAKARTAARAKEGIETFIDGDE